MAEKVWGIAIPGLAMCAAEIPALPGLVVLENPGLGSAPSWNSPYTLEELAASHWQTIQTILAEREPGPITLIGMSMGGMVLAIIADQYRNELPTNLKLRFLVTTPNISTQPAIPDRLMASWEQARPGVVETFANVLREFFSEHFIETNPAKTHEFFSHRAFGGNGQSAKGFFMQVAALRQCKSFEYFERLDGQNATFIGGGDDKILGPIHSEQLRSLVPRAKHVEIANVGHMVNLEKPSLFEQDLDGIL